MKMVWPPVKMDILDRVRHPNLVRMYDNINVGDDIFVVMELIDGGEFFEYCERIGCLPEKEARVFWRQLASGVDYLHRMGICHRDIKLENLVLDSNHNLKLIDFGKSFVCLFCLFCLFCCFVLFCLDLICLHTLLDKRCKCVVEC